MARFLGDLVRAVLAAAALAVLLAGLPWALCHYVGWPLPDHVPTWPEIEGLLLSPMSTTFLLDVLACATWVVWALFVLDVLGAAVDTTRHLLRHAQLPDWSADGPMQRVAGVLVGAILVSLLTRSGPAIALADTAPQSAPWGGGTPVVATAPAWDHPAGPRNIGVSSVGVRPAVHLTDSPHNQQHPHTSADHHRAGNRAEIGQATRSVQSAVVLEYNPGTGIHDSLWRIADRTLGDGHRWPEIFALNKGKPQPGGHTLTRPSLIYPGEELKLPPGATAPVTPPGTAPGLVPASPDVPTRPNSLPPSSSAVTPPTSGVVTPVPSTAPAPETMSPPVTLRPPLTSSPLGMAPAAPVRPGTPVADPGFAWEGLFVGLGLVSAIGATLVVARRRQHSRYRPGSGDRSDLLLAPVVYELNLAHLRATDPDDDRDDRFGVDDVEIELDRPNRRPRPTPAPPVVLGRDVGDVGDHDVEPGLGDGIDDGAVGLGDHATVVPVGTRTGREMALDVAVARGLGLLGDGAPAALRALIVAALTTTRTTAHTLTGAPTITPAIYPPVTPAGRPGGNGPGTDRPGMDGYAAVLVPAEDVTTLLGQRAAHRPLPAGLHVMDDLDTALDALEAEILTRVGHDETSNGTSSEMAGGTTGRRAGRVWAPVVLVACASRRHTRRMQAVLDNGSSVGVIGLLLGQWSPGVSVYVRDDGIISATNPGIGQPLRGTRVFRLGDDHLADLLALLHQADRTIDRAPDAAAAGPELEFLATADDQIAPPPLSDPHARPGNPNQSYPASATDPRNDGHGSNGHGGNGHSDNGRRGDAGGGERGGDEERRDDGDLEILRSTSSPGSLAGRVPGVSAGGRLRRDRSGRPRPITTDQPDPSTADRPHTASADEPQSGGARTGGTEAPADHQQRTATTDGELPLVSVPLQISVLGPPRVWIRCASAITRGETPDTVGGDVGGEIGRDVGGDVGGQVLEREITSMLAPQQRELLVFLALHPDGVTREALVGAVWASSPPEKTTNAMNGGLTRLRRALTAATDGTVNDLVLVGEGRYQLNPALVEVDYWDFAAAAAARRAVLTDADRVPALRAVVDAYRGPLADGMSTDWMEAARLAVAREATDAVVALARALVEHEPQQTLDLLETARAFDPHNEAIYRDIMRLQARLGQFDAIPRTLTLLTTRLAELDDRPTPLAIDLAQGLSHRHDVAEYSGISHRPLEHNRTR